MKFNIPLAMSATLLLTTSAHADDATVATKLEEQEQRINTLERKLKTQDAVVATDATLKASPSGFSIQSGDGKNAIKFHGNFQLDGRWFSDQSTPVTADTWLLRRARPYIEGTLDDKYDFRLMPDFAGGKAIILDAYLAARLQPWAIVQAGKFKGPVGLERLQPDQYTRFMELGFPSSLVPNRDIGVQFSGAILKGALTYAMGYFDGTADGVSTDANSPTSDVDNDGKKDIEARIFTQPFLNSDNFYLRGLGIGVAGTTVSSTGAVSNTLLPSYRTPGQQTFFSYRANTATAGTPNNATYADGNRKRIVPQAYYYVGSLGVIAEYARVSQDVSRQVSTTVKNSNSIDVSAWQVSASFFLTGEKASYSSFSPNTTFAIGNPGWGAWEIAARYHELRIGDNAFDGGANSFADPATQPRKASAIGVGVNWYLNQNLKWQFNYERTQFEGGAINSGNRNDERAFLTRFALVF